MDKTDKPKSVREIINKLVMNWTHHSEEAGQGVRHIDQALQSIYSLLGEGVEDKVCSTPIISPAEYVTHDMALDACEPEMEGQVYKGETAEQCGGCIECIQAQANAAWRKHLQERLG